MKLDLLANRSKLSLGFEHYWRSLQEGTRVPEYARFDPLEIPALIPNLVIIEIGPSPAREMSVRLAGSTTRQNMGINVAGHDAHEFYDEADREYVRASAEALIETPCGVVQRNNVQYEKADNAVTEMTFFPLSGKTGDTFYVVGVADWVGYQFDQSSDRPMKVQLSDHYAWIDVGSGIPDF